MLPIVSIVTPSFNQAKFIERTIQSVLSQNYPHLEYIVVDGGSTDETLDILRRYETRLTWISEKDTGQSSAINKGFRMAKGEVVAWLNSDDVYMPSAIGKAVEHFIKHPDVMMVYGEGYMMDEAGDIKCRFPFTEPTFDLWKLIYYGDYILQQTTFFRRSVFESIGVLEENLHYGMDWDLFIRIGKRFRVDYVPEYLGCIREHSGAKTNVGGWKRFRELVRVIRKHGILRYPQSYFNYAWEASGKRLHINGDSDATWGKERGSLLRSMRKVLLRAFCAYMKGLHQGYYSDGWVGRNALLVMPNLGPEIRDKRLMMSGETHLPNIPLQIKVHINKTLVLNDVLEKPGSFKFTTTLPQHLADADCYHIEIKNSRTFVPLRNGISPDSRELGFLLKSIDISGKSKAKKGPSDKGTK